MVAQIYLLTPPTAEPTKFPALLKTILSAAPVSALLVCMDDRSPADYAALIRAILPIAQPAACAVLVENDFSLAAALGADGVHVDPDIKLVKSAIAALKPAMIVGVGPCTSRHEAMSVGELDVDYLLFGPLRSSARSNDSDLAQWWAQTFEVPAVLSDPDAEPDQVDVIGAEFMCLSQSLWQHKDPSAYIAAFAKEQDA
ncbi:thiamine phosphate synthase [Devosia algicola]|uniref:Thiamine phosphate synthase n=1 Tax=Devosia algicola TaxID=3026418 RepID=A0ABY7YIU2_9HYPH|nr:thiamine phosphate synthase [Devosia algicola]WDR01177.1 thiamine phosphate synthase [Devosia algicola]